MINIKDIMVGDYLRVNRDGCIKKGTIVEVRGIDADSRFDDHIGHVSCHPLDHKHFDGGVWCDFLDPIPLTPEILEKNGFVYNDLPFVQSWEQFGLSLYLGGDGYRINCGQNVAMVIDSIHQLQHALKLCGINLEIKI